MDWLFFRSATPAAIVVSRMNSLWVLDHLGSQVDIWHCRTNGMVFDDEKKRYAHCLTHAEQEKAENFLFERDRLNSLMSRALLRLSLSWYCPDVDAKDWPIAIDSLGKPYLDAVINGRHIEFNISHSGDVVLCAVTRTGPVGIDIETTKHMSDLQGFSRRFLAPEEFFALSRKCFTERNSFFFKLWTLKEAYLKAIGSGLNVSLDSFSFDCDSLDSKHITLLYGASSELCWHFWQFFYGENAYPVALAVSADKPIKIVWREPALIGLSQCERSLF